MNNIINALFCVKNININYKHINNLLNMHTYIFRGMIVGVIVNHG